MSEPVDKVLSDFADAWNAGARPAVSEYLERVAAGDRAELAEQIETWLMVAPAPAYSDEALADIARAPALAGALAAIEDERGALAVELPRLRKLAGVSLADVSARIVEAFSLPRQDAKRAAEYLAGVETGAVAGEGLSRRLLDVIGEAVGATGAQLAAAASIRPQRPATDALFFRKDGEVDGWVVDDLDVLAQAAFAAAPATREADELDRLFHGGIDA